MGDGGKGSAPRPFSVDQDTFTNNWEAIFGRKDNTGEVRGTSRKDSDPQTGDDRHQEHDPAVQMHNQDSV